MTKYTTTHPVTGELVPMHGVRRDGVKYATWAHFSDSGWTWIGASKADSIPAATKSARSTAPYASDWTAMPVVVATPRPQTKTESTWYHIGYQKALRDIAEMRDLGIAGVDEWLANNMEV